MEKHKGRLAKCRELLKNRPEVLLWKAGDGSGEIRETKIPTAKAEG